MTKTQTTLLALVAGLAAAQSVHAATGALTVEDRVACQRAVEQVYWRHRGTTSDAHRLPFEQAVPEALVRRKAEDAVRKSAALAQWWDSALSPAQLQAELDRMAAGSQSPAVFAELLAALGQDPLRAAECLARPALADRLIQGYFAQDERFQGAVRRQARAEWQAVRRGGPAETAEQREMHWVRDHAVAQSAGPKAQWLSPEAFAQRVKALRRAEGGKNGQPTLGSFGPLREDDHRIHSLAIDVLDDQQVKLRSVSWPKADFDRWWSAQRKQLPLALPHEAASYRLPTVVPNANCRDDSWKPTLAGLDGRYEHGAVWTGSEMIVWGGMEAAGALYGDGARYNPATDTWTPMSKLGAPSARHAFVSAWSGQEMVVFGGTGDTTGGRYDPVTDTWRPTSTLGAPVGQQWSASAWTGKELVVWGGILGVPVNTGARYNPKTDTWQTLPPAPLAPRSYLPAVWTGSEVVIWSGYDVTQGRLYRDGARYNPATNTWTAISTTNAPEATFFQTAIWTGTEVLSWGGVQGAPANGRYNPATDTWAPISTTGAPTNRYNHNAVWMGTEMLVDERRALDRRAAAATTPPPTPGKPWPPPMPPWAARPAPWFGPAPKPCCGVGWMTTSASAPTVGRYNPATDRWKPMTTMNVPTARGYHNAEWTGAEMVVWSGYGSMATDRGARFDPATNTWTPMSIVGQPLAAPERQLGVDRH